MRELFEEYRFKRLTTERLVVWLKERADPAVVDAWHASWFTN
jgi:hypothetical protein